MPDNNDSPPRLRTGPFAAKAATSPQDDEFADSDLPDTSGPYQAHSRPANKPVYTLHCWLGKNGYRSFQYVHLDSDSSFRTEEGGQVIRLRFIGTQVMEVTIKGRQLWRLYDYVHQHRISWIMLADRNLANEKERLITAIEIMPVEAD